MLLNLPMAIGELSSSKVGHDILRCVFLFIDHFLSESSIAVPSSESTKATELAIRESVIDLSKSICSAMPSSLCCCSSPSSRFLFSCVYIINHYIFVPSNLGIVNRSSCSLFLPQNVFPINTLHIRYRLDDFFYFIFFDNRPPSRSADGSGYISDTGRQPEIVHRTENGLPSYGI